jgi:hypothetical protein
VDKLANEFGDVSTNASGWAWELDAELGQKVDEWNEWVKEKKRAKKEEKMATKAKKAKKAKEAKMAEKESALDKLVVASIKEPKFRIVDGEDAGGWIEGVWKE